MGFPTYTYTFTNSTTADATQVNQDFNDILNGVSDGTKNISVSAGTFAGTLTANGNVTLGTTGSNTITVNGSLASTFPVLTNNSFDIGSSTLGIRAYYAGCNSTFTTKIAGNSSLSGSWTFTLPVNAGTNLYTLQTDGSGNTSWAAPAQSVDFFQNYSLSETVAANAMTVVLAGAGGTALSGSNVASFSFRNTTAATGQTSVLTFSANMSLVIPSGATLGTISAQNQYIYFYVIQDTTTEIAVCGSRLFDEGALQSATAITSGSTVLTTLYATSNHTSRPVRYIGRMLVNEATAGTWASNATEISLFTSYQNRQERAEVWVNTPNGHGAVNTHIRIFSNTVKTVGTAITYATSANSGASFTISEPGIYSMTWYGDNSSGGSAQLSVSLNSATLNGDASSTEALANTRCSTSLGNSLTVTEILNPGDVIRPHSLGATLCDSVSAYTGFRIIKVNG